MSKQEKNSGISGKLEKFLPILSHQLKSPINAVQTILQTINEGFAGEINPKTKYLIEKAGLRAEEAKKLIEDLLSFQQYSEIDKEKTDRLDITSLLDRLCKEIAVTAEEKGQSFICELKGPRKVIISGDESALIHAFKNLLENAVKYCPEGGEVRLDLSFDEGEKKVWVTVSDTGYGIPRDEQEKVFEPFFRSMQHKAGSRGTGLGLPIVKEIIEAHGGSIALDSVPGKGSSFRVTLTALAVEEKHEEEKAERRVVIIGGITAGPKAAARIGRLDPETMITVIERGEFLSYSGCRLPDFIGSKDANPLSLRGFSENRVKDRGYFSGLGNIRILNHTEAVFIDPEAKEVITEERGKERKTSIPYDVLILASGSRPYIPDVPGIELSGIYPLHDLENAIKIKQKLFDKPPKDAVILGGGLIGVSSCEALMRSGARLTVVEKEAELMPGLLEPDFGRAVQNELRRRGVKVRTGSLLKEISKAGESLHLSFEKGSISADCIILAAGVIPETRLALTAGLECGPSGGIRVDRNLRSSRKEIYAVGDCAESINLISGKHEYWPLGSVSTKMGRIAADNICGIESPFTGSLGTAYMRFFDLRLARSGLTSRAAREAGFDPCSFVISAELSSNAAESRPVFIKVIADSSHQKLLGVQGFGSAEVVDKVVLAASGMSRGIRLEEVFELDLGYSPHYNRPVDLIQTACLSLKNKLEGRMKTISPLVLLEGQNREDFDIVVDVSPHSAYNDRSIPGSINVPLRGIARGSFPAGRDDRILLYSRTSASAYEATCILSRRGYTELSLLEGGYLYWNFLK